MFILLIDVDDDTRSVVFNDLSLHDSTLIGGLEHNINVLHKEYEMQISKIWVYDRM